MNIAGHDIGVCSWSLHPKDTPDLIARVKELGLAHLQLNTLPIVMMDDKQKHYELGLIRNSGLTITAGMIGFPGEDYTTIASIRRTGGFVADDQWEMRKKLVGQAAALTAELGVQMLSSHVGFIPPSSDPKYGTMIERIRDIASILGEHNLILLMETGQETAPELLQFLNDLPVRNVKVNFDPANMILYGAGDPIDAVSTLGRHIGHVHIKDAIMSDKPGVEWGTEVPFGSGQVPPREFIDALHSVGYRSPLVIEREAGDQRMADVAIAIETLKKAATP
ncbi:MAG TPA: sugar phosphate isomerase/epimerase family protein [Tepidisphaeraceae bacterium]|jgi:sugar phosphate isomerase/epimerase